MPLSVNILTTGTDCDAFVGLQTKARAVLLQQQLVLTYQLTQFDATTPVVEGGLAVVTLQLAGIGAYINTMPVGSSERAKLELEKERLDVRQRLLSGRRETWGVVARLDTEVDLMRVEAELVVLNTVIAQVQAHKLTL